MMIPEGTCTICEFKDECLIIRKKLYGRNGGLKSKDANGEYVYTPEVPEQVSPQPA